MGEKTYSIQLRIRRITFEDAYVCVPVTDAVTETREDGSIGINGKALFAEGVRISADPRVEWKAEENQMQAHPIQAPAPQGREVFDAFYHPDA